MQAPSIRPEPGVSWDSALWAVGLMSGTSLDGVDAALIRSDGRGWVETGAALSRPYDAAFREDLRRLLGQARPSEAVLSPLVRKLTERHAEAVEDLLAQSGLAPEAVGVIGFHGQTIAHDPAAGITCQIGDGDLLAASTGIPVVTDFRSRDVAAGGEGAPLAPLYHAALASKIARPLAVINIGGVANVTWLGPGPDDLLAFDTGPGNALLDDWVLRTYHRPMDTDGALARAGRVHEDVLERLLDNPYFARPAPKSLDRDAFDFSPVTRLSPEDGAATLTAFTAEAIGLGAALLPSPPHRWLVCGGGRRNPAHMAALAARLSGPVEPVEAVGWDGDCLEAQAFAYLAIRSLCDLPLSLPGTTGVSRPTTGGRLHRAAGGSRA